MSVTKKHKKPVRLGMPVHTLDGEVGRSSRIITDPESRQPIYLAVKIGGVRRRREVVVPVSLVSSVSAETINLDITSEALANFPAYEFTYRKGRYEKPYPIGNLHYGGAYKPAANSAFLVLKQRSVPDQSVAVEKGMVIHDCTGQEVGKVEGLILDQEERQGKFIVFRRDHFSPLQLIPADLVQDASSTEVKLHIDLEFVEKLPEYSERTAQRWSA